MIRYVKNEDIDRVKWDQLIDASWNKSYYAYSWYLDIICFSWDALVEDDYLSAMPVSKSKKYMLSYVLAPMFAQQLGIFSRSLIDQKKTDAFVARLPKDIFYMDANLNYGNDFVFKGFERSYMSNYELDLNKEYSELRKEISENTRRNIKKAQQTQLLIEKNRDVDTVITLFKKNKGDLYTHIKPKNYATLKTLMLYMLERKQAEVWYVKDTNGAIFVGGFFLIFEDRIIFLFSGRTEEAKNNGAVFFLFHQLIVEYAGKAIVLDFAGSNDPGVARMYKSFGAEERKYLRIVKNRLPFFIKWLKK